MQVHSGLTNEDPSVRISPPCSIWVEEWSGASYRWHTIPNMHHAETHSPRHYMHAEHEAICGWHFMFASVDIAYYNQQCNQCWTVAWRWLNSQHNPPLMPKGWAKSCTVDHQRHTAPILLHVHSWTQWLFMRRVYVANLSWPNMQYPMMNAGYCRQVASRCAGLKIWASRSLHPPPRSSQ